MLVIAVPASRRRSKLKLRPFGNVLLPAKAAGLPKESVANASQIIAVDRAFLAERVAKLPPKHFAQVMSCQQRL
jgi:mRNA-degrading endonuclease toxin of MazEF toxin-antitoxin module